MIAVPQSIKNHVELLQQFGAQFFAIQHGLLELLVRGCSRETVSIRFHLCVPLGLLSVRGCLVSVCGYGAITLNGNTQANLSAPTLGPLVGILFFQDRSIPSTAAGSTITGNSSSTFDGGLYFETTQLTFGGNSSASGYSIVVADKLTVSGNSSVGSN